MIFIFHCQMTGRHQQSKDSNLLSICPKGKLKTRMPALLEMGDFSLQPYKGEDEVEKCNINCSCHLWECSVVRFYDKKQLSNSSSVVRGSPWFYEIIIPFWTCYRHLVQISEEQKGGNWAVWGPLKQWLHQAETADPQNIAKVVTDLHHLTILALRFQGPCKTGRHLRNKLNTNTLM